MVHYLLIKMINQIVFVLPIKKTILVIMMGPNQLVQINKMDFLMPIILSVFN
jgi:hypothetical protein